MCLCRAVAPPLLFCCGFCPLATSVHSFVNSYTHAHMVCNHNLPLTADIQNVTRNPRSAYANPLKPDPASLPPYYSVYSWADWANWRGWMGGNGHNQFGQEGGYNVALTCGIRSRFMLHQPANMLIAIEANAPWNLLNLWELLLQLCVIVNWLIP